MRLVIGNKNYSSWSLRPWILMKRARVAFEEVRIPLFSDQGDRMLEELCPARQVPVLYDGPLVLWDSLAICEYIADRHPARHLWPTAAADRARARAISAEMHSGFRVLRERMPMNCRRRLPDFAPDLETQIDINRLVQLIEGALADSDGPWLFGRYSIADAMFTPVASRFRTYDIAVPPATREWCGTILEDAWMQHWYADAEHEADVIERAEV